MEFHYPYGNEFPKSNHQKIWAPSNCPDCPLSKKKCPFLDDTGPKKNSIKKFQFKSTFFFSKKFDERMYQRSQKVKREWRCAFESQPNLRWKYSLQTNVHFWKVSLNNFHRKWGWYCDQFTTAKIKKKLNSKSFREIWTQSEFMEESMSYFYQNFNPTQMILNMFSSLFRVWSLNLPRISFWIRAHFCNLQIIMFLLWFNQSSKFTPISLWG